MHSDQGVVLVMSALVCIYNGFVLWLYYLYALCFRASEFIYRTWNLRNSVVLNIRPIVMMSITQDQSFHFAALQFYDFQALSF